MEVTDLLLLDIKEMNPERHRRLTGRDNRNILEFARYLSEIRKPVWIRHVLVPERSDFVEDLQALRAFTETLANVERIEVLPYHTLGVFKWENMEIEYPAGRNPAAGGGADRPGRRDSGLQEKSESDKIRYQFIKVPASDAPSKRRGGHNNYFYVFNRGAGACFISNRVCVFSVLFLHIFLVIRNRVWNLLRNLLFNYEYLC